MVRKTDVKLLQVFHYCLKNEKHSGSKYKRELSECRNSWRRKFASLKGKHTRTKERERARERHTQKRQRERGGGGRYTHKEERERERGARARARTHRHTHKARQGQKQRVSHRWLTWLRGRLMLLAFAPTKSLKSISCCRVYVAEHRITCAFCPLTLSSAFRMSRTYGVKCGVYSAINSLQRLGRGLQYNAFFAKSVVRTVCGYAAALSTRARSSETQHLLQISRTVAEKLASTTNRVLGRLLMFAVRALSITGAPRPCRSMWRLP